MYRKLFLFYIIMVCLFFLANCAAHKNFSRRSPDRGLTGVAVQPPLRPAVSLRILKYENNGEKEIRSGDVLTGKDFYAVSFIPGNPAFVYIFQVDSHGKKIRIFPNEEFSPEKNPLSPENSYRIPPKGKWFELDQNTGTEQIILIARNKKLKKPEKICEMVMNGELQETYAKDRRVMGKRKEFPYEISMDESELLIRKAVFEHR